MRTPLHLKYSAPTWQEGFGLHVSPNLVKASMGSPLTWQTGRFSQNSVQPLQPWQRGLGKRPLAPPAPVEHLRGGGT